MTEPRDDPRTAHPRAETPRIFLLSPANCGGERAQLVMSPRARFPLAARLQSRDGAALGEVMSFLSGLYFRGKLAYARAFAQPPDPTDPRMGGGVLVITANAGLRPSDSRITMATLRASAGVPIDVGNPRYRRPLERTARALARRVGPRCDVVLLGSIASPKYVDVLLGIFGDRLRFPIDFVGRGDMSRGGLMLRCVTERRELPYVSVAGAIRHGQRPPKLAPLVRTTAP